MIKSEDIRHREKFNIPARVQVADTVLLTQEMMILNHILDPNIENRNTVVEVISSLEEKLGALTLKTINLIYLYNDEQIYKTKTKWKNAGVIKFRGVVYKLVSPLELSTLRARLLLRKHLLRAIKHLKTFDVKQLENGNNKIEYRTSPDATMNFKPEWMNW